MPDHALLTTCRCGHLANRHRSTADCTLCRCMDFHPDRHQYPIGECVSS